jgi:hypothetical protein
VGEMKKIIRVLVFSLSVAAIIMAFVSNSLLFAVSGCCKSRENHEESWRANKLSLEECREENYRKDRDNLFQRRGLIWWDSECR